MKFTERSAGTAVHLLEKSTWARRLTFRALRILATFGYRDEHCWRRLFDAALSIKSQEEAMRYGAGALTCLDIPRLTTLAQIQLLNGDIHGAARSFSHRQSRKSESPLEIRVCRYALLDQAKGQVGDAYIKTLDNVLVDTGYWAIIDGDKVYARETYSRNFANSPFVRARESPDGLSCIAAFPTPSVSINDPCVFLGSDVNYSHWLLRSLLKLVLVERDPGLRGLPYVVRDDLSSFQKQYLEILGIPDEQVVIVPSHEMVSFSRLYVPTQLVFNRNAAAGIDWLRSKVSAFLRPESEATELLFVSRKESSNRILVNEDELYEALKPYGFRLVTPGTMSVREQLAAFSAARTIVTAHGAALTNMIFSWPHCRFVEIVSSHIAHMEEFRWLAGLRGQRMVTVESADYVMDDARKKVTRKMHWDYRVAVDDVVAALLAQQPELARRKTV